MIMRKLEKSESYGATGSILFGILLLLLLFLIKLSYSETRDEGGGDLNIVDLEKSFSGGGNSGQGFFRPEPASVVEPVKPVSSPKPASPAPNYLTQDFDPSIAIEKAAAEQRLKEAAEQKRIEEERLAEQRRKEEEQARRIAEIRSRTQGSFANSGSSEQGTSSGSGSASGNTGTGLGTNSGSAGGGAGAGTSFKLGNRKTEALPKPTDNARVEGIIVVDIKVDEAGNVIDVSIGQGTTITEKSTRNAVLEAARKSRFTKGDKTEIGTITYYFSLN